MHALPQYTYATTCFAHSSNCVNTSTVVNLVHTRNEEYPLIACTHTISSATPIAKDFSS